MHFQLFLLSRCSASQLNGSCSAMFFNLERTGSSSFKRFVFKCFIFKSTIMISNLHCKTGQKCIVRVLESVQKLSYCS
uniref:Uncharacterized protein n=1 Tax=Anguilla anguilla TaxID=7936 RepID=A0A0E9XB39_ANGAN